MHINAKNVSFCGLLLALTEVCIVLGSVIESNTLFLLAAASYLVGIVIREEGCRYGLAFYLAGVLLGLMIAPNKFYVGTYGAMGLYILLREWIWDRIGRLSVETERKRLFCLLRFLLFNGIYLLLLLVGRGVIFAGNGSFKWIGIAVIIGQVGFVVYDLAYEYVQTQVWTKLRRRLGV